MADYLKTGFTTVDATLTPTPFDAVVEQGASVTFRADPTGGTNGGAGAAITWTGSPPTHLTAYGTKIFANIGPPLISSEMQNRPTHLRISFQLAIPTVTGFTTNDRLKIFQVMGNDENGAEIELFSISWQKTASAYRWRIDSFDGSSTLGEIFNPTGFAYATYQGYCIDFVMKPEVAFVNIGAVWQWNNPYSAQHVIPTASAAFFARESTSHIPTKFHFGVISGINNVTPITAPSAASEFNFDDIFVCDNLMDNPGLIRPNKSGAIGSNFSSRSPELTASLEVDFAQGAPPYPSFCVFGAIPSTNKALLHSAPSTQIAIDEGAVYKVALTMADPVYPNQDDPASETGLTSGDGSIYGRGYTQIYTSKYNADDTALPSVPYWGMAQPIQPVSYIVVPPGHNVLTIYNGEFIAFEVYVHRVRFPF